MPTSLRAIANKATTDKAHRFRNLFGLLTSGFLGWCWGFLNWRASPGVDRVSARRYGEDLLANLEGLAGAVKGGWYRAKLVLRKYIPKTNGKMRPLGIPSVADKVLQMAVKKILEAIYEADFLGCSYGYRPGRGAHDALRELSAKLRSGPYHCVVEADIQSFFDRIDHEALMAMLERRIDDKPFLRLIGKWLKAGVLEPDGTVVHPVTGSPQGGVVSPVLANIYLHHVLDEWVEGTVKAHCRGAVYFCRYADDFVCAFEREDDARRYYEALGKRLERYGLTLAADKTRLLRFSRLDRQGSGRFDFLGFEFSWGKSRYGAPQLKRRTSRKKYRASLAALQAWALEHVRKLSKPAFFARLNAKLRGYYRYYALRGNYESLSDFRHHAVRLLFRVFNRRSQRRSYTWAGFAAMLEHYRLERPRIVHDF